MEPGSCKTMSQARLVNAVVVFIAPDARKTAKYYRDVLGFRVVEHFDKEESFAALYRDEIEIIVVQSRFGNVTPNQLRYGAGYDAYLDPEDPEDVDTLYTEWTQKGAKIVHLPRLTSYGCYEFVLEDIDGRRIGVGRIKDSNLFFRE
jgi:catechol 2,3-dioxygenase-like lactoylglutathione lyase family enzyme